MMLKVVLFMALIVVNSFVKSKTVPLQTTHLLRNENLSVKKINEIIHGSRETLQLLLRQQEQFKQTVPPSKNRTRYLENFSNALTLVSRTAKVWRGLRFLMTTTFGDTMLKPPNITLNTTNYWVTAVEALVRIQEVYNISTDKLANGGMEGANPNTQLLADDCVDVALYYYKWGHFERAVQWFDIAQSKAITDHSVDRQQVLEYLSLAHCLNGNAKKSAATFLTLLQEYPFFTPSENLQDKYKLMANTTCKILGEKMINKFYKDFSYEHGVLALQGLCDKRNYKPVNDSQLRCRLIHYNQPHLKIAPYKMEEVVLDPPVLLFYDVITNDVMNKIITTSHNKTRPAMEDYDPSYTDPSQDTQFNSWIFNKSADGGLGSKVARLSERITNAEVGHGTDRTMIASYGLGAEIKLHVDLGEDSEILSPGYSRPDYISLMFWLNDVEEGGYTVFPLLDLAVLPVKGAAVLWFNRYPDWESIFESHHTGCPILRGTKWILTHWFHVRAQNYPLCFPGKEKSYKYYYL